MTICCLRETWKEWISCTTSSKERKKKRKSARFASFFSFFLEKRSLLFLSLTLFLHVRTSVRGWVVVREEFFLVNRSLFLCSCICSSSSSSSFSFFFLLVFTGDYYFSTHFLLLLFTSTSHAPLSLSLFGATFSALCIGSSFLLPFFLRVFPSSMSSSAWAPLVSFSPRCLFFCSSFLILMRIGTLEKLGFLIGEHLCARFFFVSWTQRYYLSLSWDCQREKHEEGDVGRSDVFSFFRPYL